MSRVVQSLVQDTDSVNRNEAARPELDTSCAFDQANRNDPATAPGVADPESANGESNGVGRLGEVITPEGLAEEQHSVSRVPAKKKRGVLTGMALLLSLVAMGVGGYSLMDQKTSQRITRQVTESLNSAIGYLDTRVDELAATLDDSRSAISANTEYLANIGELRADFQTLQTLIFGMQNEIASVRTNLESLEVAVDEHRKSINQMDGEISRIDSRKTPPVRKVADKAAAATRHAPAEKQKASTRSRTPAHIEGAYVASIDLWGTRQSVMLRESGGGWVPLTPGDYYKGWRLQGVSDSEAVFQKGGQTRKLTARG